MIRAITPRSRRRLILCGLVYLVSTVVAGCGSGGEREGPAGRILTPPAPDDDGVLKVLLSYDMEGLSGQSDWRTFMARFPEFYRQGQELLAGDVNAVVEMPQTPLRG